MKLRNSKAAIPLCH